MLWCPHSYLPGIQLWDMQPGITSMEGRNLTSGASATFNIHSTHIQTTFNLHSTHIQPTFTYIQPAFNLHSTHIHLHSTCIQPTFNLHSTHIQPTFTYIQPAFNLHSTYAFTLLTYQQLPFILPQSSSASDVTCAVCVCARAVSCSCVLP